MTSTLPNFPASPAAASAAGTGILNAAPQSGLPADTIAQTNSGDVMPEFADLLSADNSATASVTNGAAAPVIAATPAASRPTGTDVTKAPATAPSFVRPSSAAAGNTPVTETESAPARPQDISREEYEHAAAFVAALLQSLQVAAPAQSESATAPVSAADGTSESADVMLPNGRPFPTELPAQVKPGFVNRPVQAAMVATPGEPAGEAIAHDASLNNAAAHNGQSLPVTLPAQAQATFDRAPSPSNVSLPPAASPSLAATTHATASVATPIANAPVAVSPAFEVAADGAIECTVSPVVAPASSLGHVLAPNAPMEVHAELELPGRAVVRVSAELPLNDSRAETVFLRPENFAASEHGKTVFENTPLQASERNFVVAGDKQVKTDSLVDGIAVAKTEGTMSVVPTEETRQPRNPEILSVLPVRADFQVVSPTVERITVEPAAPVEQNFAERAVATVTSLAEAQFSASMHRAGSVQLRLKFGGDDLTVRVELREGVVHTDFRTDSPALREALAKEWQAVAAAAPGHLQRFLDPVFSPASSSNSPADAGAQHQSAHRHAQQQAQQEQFAHRAEAWASASPFSRRSALSESFVPEPAVPRVPAFLPTSLRLSVLA